MSDPGIPVRYGPRRAPRRAVVPGAPARDGVLVRAGELGAGAAGGGRHRRRGRRRSRAHRRGSRDAGAGRPGRRAPGGGIHRPRGADRRRRGPPGPPSGLGARERRRAPRPARARGGSDGRGARPRDGRRDAGGDGTDGRSGDAARSPAPGDAGRAGPRVPRPAGARAIRRRGASRRGRWRVAVRRAEPRRVRARLGARPDRVPDVRRAARGDPPLRVRPGVGAPAVRRAHRRLPLDDDDRRRPDPGAAGDDRRPRTRSPSSGP